VGPRVRLGLNVGATEGEVTEEVVFEALVSSLTDSAVDVFIDLVMPTEGETVVALLAPTRVRLLPSRTRMNQESMLTYAFLLSSSSLQIFHSKYPRAACQEGKLRFPHFPKISYAKPFFLESALTVPVLEGTHR